MDAMSAPSTPGPGIRIGNDERAAAMAALDEHMAAGRLDPEEYGERVAQASVARTRAELDELFVDLPAPHPFPSAPPPRIRRTDYADRTLRRYAGDSPLVRLVVLVVAAVVFLAVLPFLAVGALLVFVVLPMVTRGGLRGARIPGRQGWRW
jgi:hypothetical protein